MSQSFLLSTYQMFGMILCWFPLRTSSSSEYCNIMNIAAHEEYSFCDISHVIYMQYLRNLGTYYLLEVRERVRGWV